MPAGSARGGITGDSCSAGSGGWAAGDVLTGIEQDEATQAILLCIDKLPAGQREAIYRTAVEEEGLAEASRDMEVPEGTRKSRLFHARQRIRDCLARAFGPDYLGGNRG